MNHDCDLYPIARPGVRLGTAAVCLLVTASSHAATLLVPGQYATVSSALAVSADGDTVAIACGTYFESSLTLPPGVMLLGHPDDPACVTLDGQGLDRILSCPGATSGNVIRGITFTHGAALGDYPAGNGGAIVLTFVVGSPAFEDCSFLENHSDHEGGAVHAGASGSPSFLRCTFRDNTAGRNGGAVCATWGGVSACMPTFADCMFERNDALFTGGAFAVSGSVPGTAAMDGCIFRENSAGVGGAIYYAYSELRVTDCLFLGNRTDYGGGGLYLGGENPGLDRHVELQGTSFTGNLAQMGGAFRIEGGSATLTGCTIAGNRSTADGGGVSLDTGSTLTAENTVLWGNCALLEIHAPQIALQGGSSASFACSVVDSSGNKGTGTVDFLASTLFEDPRFCAPEVCMYSPLSSGDYRVAADSPCLEGNSGGCGLIGAWSLGQDCLSAVSDVSWGRVKAGFRSARSP